MVLLEKQNEKSHVARRSTARQDGFSLIELLVVIAIIIVMTAMAIFAAVGHKKAYRTEDQAMAIMDFMREASSRALTRRRTIRFEIDLTDKVMRIVDENNTFGVTTDDAVLRVQTLSKDTDVRLNTTTNTSQPTGISVVPPSPSNYAAAPFANDTSSHLVWAIRFRSNGAAYGATVATANVPTSATLMLWQPQIADPNKAQNATLVRAITVFGASGAVRYWKYDGSAFVAY